MDARPPLSRTTDPALFPAIFRSILVAGLAAEGCAEIVTPTPDASGPDAVTTPNTPDASAPDVVLRAEGICSAGRSNYSVFTELDALRSGANLDYIELRTISRVSWDGGLDPSALWMTTGTSGTRCASATSSSACEAAFAALPNEPSFGTTYAWVVLYTRGDAVGAVRNVEDFVRLYGPIDAAPEAAFVATYRHDITVPCVDSVRRSLSGGWEVRGRRDSCPSNPRVITHVLVRVAPDGTSTATTTGTMQAGGCPVPGRRPDGLRAVLPDAHGSVERWLARAAHMEAAAVRAFESLARELDALGAPATLIESARRSADDERRHARVMRRLAEREGATVPPVEVDAPKARTAYAIALENAVEGCVHETWAAMEALTQSSRATLPGVAGAMAAIADDEIRHAALAWEVAAWIEPRLTADERRAVEEARDRARESLEAAVARGHDTELTDTLGLPPPRLAARLAASLHATLSPANHVLES